MHLQSADLSSGRDAMRRIHVGLLAVLAAAACQATEPVQEPVPEPVQEPAQPQLTRPDIPPAAFEPPGPGTIVIGRREDGALARTRVLGVDGFALRLEEDGARVARIPFCYGCGDPRYDAVDMDAYAALWPLEVGKTTTFRRETEDGTVRLHTVTVTGTDTLETEIGPVAVFVVREEARAAGAAGWRATRTVWHAPQLDWPVKVEWQESGGVTGSWDIAAMGRMQRDP